MASIQAPKPTSECVQVMVRARPMNKRELAQKTSMCVEIDKSINGIIVTPPGASKETTRQFTYDVVYGEDSTQRQVYDEGAFSLVESVMNGYNGTIFAYGQTGCGKTHTMIGVKGDKSQNGIIPNAFDHIFGYFDDAVNFKKKFLIRCSYLEIYNESIRDLLSKDIEAKLDLKETPDTGVYVKGLTTCIVKSIPEIEAYMDHGTKNRMTGETAMNKDSSRSHSIFTIYVETSEADEEGDQRIKAGKLNLVDLAGSERQSKTQATGARLKEATQINLSLSALGNVITALVEGKSNHIPYRDSKLTRLLQDSLGGNTKTVMIAAISPSDFNYEETLTTLRYASRAKMIKNKPRVNQDPKDALLKQYEDEIQKLKQIIEQSKQGTKNINNADLGQSIKMLSKDKGNAIQKEKDETVEELMAKLAKKGKKVKLLDEMESSSVKELPKQEDADGEEDALERDDDEDVNMDNVEVQVQSPMKSQQSSIKKKMTKIKDNRESKEELPSSSEQESAQKLMEAQQQQQILIEKTNQQLLQEADKRQELEQILQQMEQRLVSGGNALEEKEREQAQAQRHLQLELEQERQKQQELLIEKEQKEQDLLEKEQNYNSIQEEVQDQKKIIKKLRYKLKNAMNELKDIHEENAGKNEELLDTVREQAKELDFVNQMIAYCMNEEQIYKIKEKTEWDEDLRKWKLPAFIIKQKEIQLPKLGAIGNSQLIKEELEQQEIQFTSNSNNQYDNINNQSMNGYSNKSQQRKTNGFRKNESRHSKHRMDNQAHYGMNQNSSNAYISSNEMGSSRGQGNEFMMNRNESKSSANFTNDKQIRNQQNRLMKMNNENYVMESPDVSHKRVNKMAGVQLAPLSQQPQSNAPGGAGRNSMMSIKGMGDPENGGSDSHPILRAHNYKKPQLEKLNPLGGGGGGPLQQNNITFNVDNVNGQQNPNGGNSIQMTFQATVSIDGHQQQQQAPMTLNSKKMVGRKRDNAVLAPLNHVPTMMGHGQQSSLSQQR